MEERPTKGRLCLKLGQKKLSFQQKPQTVSNSRGNNSTVRPVSPTAANDSNDGGGLSNDSTAIKEESTREIPPLSGLCNLGNTCYVNSLLQPLRFCPQFSQWIGELHHHCTQQPLASLQPSEENAGAVGAQVETETRQAPGINATNYLSSNNGLREENAVDCSEPPAKESRPSTAGLASHLHTLWQRMAQKERAFVKPTNKVSVLSATRPDSFIARLKEENPLFDNKLQQDAQEMLRYTLTSLQETYTTAAALKSHSSSIQSDIPPPTCESSELIDVDIYRPKNSPQLPLLFGSRKRKLSSSDPGRKACKVIKLNNKNTTTCRSKIITEYFTKAKPPPPSDGGRVRQPAERAVDSKAEPVLTDFITDRFQGEVAYQMRCYECDGCTRRTEPFLDVSVPVTSSADILPGFPCEVSPIKPSVRSSLLSGMDVGPHSLSWALSQFALREKLRGENKYFCDECGHFVEAERSVLFSHLSSVMTIHLNRFTTQVWGVTSTTVSVNKVGGNLAIPLSLSFGPWCTEDCRGRDTVYHLFAVVFHSGSSCSSGHYTACVRGKECGQLAPKEVRGRFEDNGWIYFDDDQIDFVSQSELLDMMSPLSNNASTVYILFYTCI